MSAVEKNTSNSSDSTGEIGVYLQAGDVPGRTSQFRPKVQKVGSGKSSIVRLWSVALRTSAPPRAPGNNEQELQIITWLPEARAVG